MNYGNIMVDPVTLEITGFVDWECTISAQAFEDTYPKFLSGPEREEQPEPLTPEQYDDGLLRENWDYWEATQLRRAYDRASGSCPDADETAVAKREFGQQLYMATNFPGAVRRWIQEYRERNPQAREVEMNSIIPATEQKR
jgi:hypothetical protein